MENKKKILTPFEQKLESGLVIAGEGYLFELEKKGYIQIGSFVPLVVLENPQAVEQLHREYVDCGSDVVVALQYYANAPKLQLIGKGDLLESLNRTALQIAQKVAREKNVLLAGNICNSNIYDPDDADSIDQTRQIFEQQIQWAKEYEVDFIVAETFDFIGEAILATELIVKAGLKAVVTLALAKREIREGISLIEGAKLLEKAGASVVGLNCCRGPETMYPLLKQLVDNLTIPIAALPVPFKTSTDKPNFQALCCREKMYTELEAHLLNRHEMAEFAVEAKKMGVTYIGGCCGTAPYHIRSMAEALGKTTAASKYSADLSMHYAFGDKEKFKKIHTETQDELLLE